MHIGYVVERRKAIGRPNKNKQIKISENQSKSSSLSLKYWACGTTTENQ
jgi:hypothetical protein